MRFAVLQRNLVHSRALQQMIEKAGHHCTLFDDGLSLQRALARSTVDLLILDWHSQRLSGADVLRAARVGGDSRLPVIFASIDGSENSIVRALSAGADDYIVLPARPREFIQRVNALLRRAYPEQHGAMDIDAGPYHFNVPNQMVTLHGEPISLSGTQFRLASLFFANIGRVLSRDHIFATVWGREFRECTRTIDSHVSRLRQLLDLEPQNDFRLQPVYKSGYRLVQLSRGERRAELQFDARDAIESEASCVAEPESEAEAAAAVERPPEVLAKRRVSRVKSHKADAADRPVSTLRAHRAAA